MFKGIKKLRRSESAAIAVLIFYSASSSVFAQDIEFSEEEALFLEELIVTAQKRTENIQDVPIALTAYGRKFLKRTGLESIEGLQEYTPGLETGHQVTQPSYTIRGIGTSDFGLGADPAVAVYIDGVYVGRSGGAQLQLSDVERVEVLKGPQGTLFGRNTAAGAIQIVTVEPTTLFTEAKLRTSIGNYEKVLVEGMINVPLSDTLAIRLNALSNDRGGYTENRSGRDLGKEDEHSVRGSALWTPNDNTSLRYIVEYDKLDQDAAVIVSINDASPDGNDPFGDTSIDLAENVESRDLIAHSIQFDYDWDNVSFTYVASFRDFDTLNRQDEEGYDRALLSTGLYSQVYLDTANIEDSEQQYHEWRFIGESNYLQWTVGASYYHEKGTQKSDVVVAAETAELILVTEGIVADFPEGAFWDESYSNKLDSTATALFADMTWNVTDEFNITGGVRYTQDEKDFSWFNASNNLDNTLPDIAFEAAGNPIKNTWVDTDDSWSNVSFRLIFDYHWHENLMTFISFAQGYKAGGFNALAVNSFYDEETIDNLEIGLRSEWFDNRMKINASVYDYRYNDRQGTLLDTSGGTSKYITTTGDAKGRGLDLSIDYLIIKGFTARISYGYLDAQWTDRIVDGANLDGEALESPKNQGALALEYSHDFNELGKIELELGHTFSSKEQFDSTSLEKVYGIEYKTKGDNRRNTHLRSSWLNTTEKIEVALWVHNLTDEEHVEDYGNLYPAFLELGVDLGITRRNLPRTYGVEFIYTF